MRIWIDIDNAPHVLIMEPIIRELERLGHVVFVTARDYGNTVELLKQKGIKFTLIGKHPGKSPVLKVIFLFLRMIGLFFWAMDKRIDVAFAHGSRSQVLPARLLGIPAITMYDYEHIADFIFKYFASMILLPFVFSDDVTEKKKYRVFPGLKEEIYLWQHNYDYNWRRDIPWKKGKRLIVIRPPASMAHYHNPEAERILERVVEKLALDKRNFVLIAPRTVTQKKELKKDFGNYENVYILERPVDGISMLKDADIVISGGGTMNREAALLGKPVYSIFQGEKGKVDAWLESIGRLRFIKREEDIDSIEITEEEMEPLIRVHDLRNWIVQRILNY